MSIIGHPAAVNVSSLDPPGSGVGLKAAVGDVVDRRTGAYHGDVVEKTGALLYEKEMQLGLPASAVVANRIAQLLPFGLGALIARLPGRGDRVVLARVDQLEAGAPAIRPDGPAAAIVIANPVHRIAPAIGQLDILPSIGKLPFVGTEDVFYSIPLANQAGIFRDDQVGSRSDRGAGLKDVVDAFSEAETGEVNRLGTPVVQFDELTCPVLRRIIEELVDDQVLRSLHPVRAAAGGRGGDPVETSAIGKAQVRPAALRQGLRSGAIKGFRREALSLAGQQEEPGLCSREVKAALGLRHDEEASGRDTRSLREGEGIFSLRVVREAMAGKPEWRGPMIKKFHPAAAGGGSAIELVE